MCSKKDYQAIAAILKDARTLDSEQASEVVDDIAAALVSYFADESKTFDKTVFYVATH
jgi:hypothetical protein